MIIRRIKQDEVKRTEELFAVSFEFAYDNSKTAAEIVDDKINRPKGREDYYWNYRWAAFLDDDKTMTSYFIDKPYPFNFDGKTYKGSGIGGVATLPQYRRHGGIRKCFEAALPSMYKDGMVFSYLYPFSTAYYRKFGYETCGSFVSYEFKPEFFPKNFDCTGSCYLLDGVEVSYDDALEDVKHVYSFWQHKYNMMIVNEDWEYDWVKKSNPPKDQAFTYIYRNGNGEATGYITFKEVDEYVGPTKNRNLIASRFIFKDIDAIKGIFNIIGSLRADHKFFKCELPEDIFLFDILPEWQFHAVTRTLNRQGMARVINVKKVLENAIYKGSGSVKVAVEDKYIPENNNTFLVEFKDNKAKSVKIVEGEADIYMDIPNFSRCIIGDCDVSRFPYMESIKVKGNLENIEKMFYKKPIFITEYF